MEITFDIPDAEILLALDAVADTVESASAREDAFTLKQAVSCIKAMKINSSFFYENSEKMNEFKCLIIVVAISETAKRWNYIMNSMLTKE